MYSIPTTNGVLVGKDGKRTSGALPKLLKTYETLGKDRAGSTIFLDEAIAMPPHYRGANRGARRNLNSAELVMLLDYANAA